jgi:hypothetical protein
LAALGLGVAVVGGGLAVVVESQAAVAHPNIYAVMPGADGVAVHVLSGSSYDVWGENALTAAPAVTDRSKWQYAFGDYNKDGIADLYAIDTKDDGDGSGLHIYDGKSRFDKVILNQKMSGVGSTADTSRFRFFTGDSDGDGADDLFLVDGKSGNGTNTAVHVFMAAARFASPSINRPLAMAAADFSRHSFASGDVDGDGHADVYFVDSGTAASASTALHVSSYTGGYLKFETNRVLPKFGFTPTSRWAFSAADYDGDSKADVIAVDSQNNGGKNLAIHVVTAASGFQKFGLQHASTVAGLNLSLVGALTAWKDTQEPEPLGGKIAGIAHGENGTPASECDKYNEACDGGALDWCAMFATWTWYKAGVDGVPRSTFVARALGLWGKNHGLFHETPQPGDWAVYGEPANAVGGHVDVVVKVNSATSVVVIGGNIDGKVRERTINPKTERSGRDQWLISGYVSPPA